MQDSLKLAGVAVLGLLCIVFVYLFLFKPAEPEKEINYSEFIERLSASKKVFVVADLRNASALSRNAIMQCAVDIAGSVPLAPKNVSFFVLEGDSCVSTELNASASYCEALSRSGMTFQIMHGNSTKYYADKIIVGMKKYESPCGVQETTVQANSSVP
ncbi:MAG: hypothetical protein WC488_03565 [Candidatus Micrarchaeia archaeon]